MSYLEVKNVVKRFGDFHAVDDVSFVAEKGEFVTLLGPSGCGKTTLLKSIAGFYEIDGGQIILDGEVQNKIPPERRDTAMCFQSYALFPHLTVQRNVSFGLEQKKMGRDVIVEKVSDILEQVALETQIAKYPNQLSGGQQQRVALARAMVTQPSIILFDEPLSNLDAKLREKVRFEIRRLQNQLGFTAIYVTHDQSEALALSDKIIVLDKGTIQQEGTPEEVYNHPKNSFVADFIGTANIMNGHITGQKGNTYTVNTDLGELSVISDKEPHGTRLKVGWRPENIVWGAHQGGEKYNKVKAKVLQSAFLGNCYHLVISINEKVKEIGLEVSQNFDVKEDEEFEFFIQADKMFFMEGSDG